MGGVAGPALLLPPRPLSRWTRLSRSDRLDLVLLGCLLLLTLAVTLGWWPVTVDRAVDRGLPALTSGGTAGTLLTLANAVTNLAAPVTTAALTLAIGLALALATRSRRPLLVVGPRLLALTVTVLGGKALLHRLGPLGDPLPPLHGYFPSGHTATALVCAGTLAAIAAERHPEWRGRLWAAVTVWTCLVAGSLVYHRYHWPSDVLGAALLGLLILRRLPGRALPPDRSGS